MINRILLTLLVLLLFAYQGPAKSSKKTPASKITFKRVSPDPFIPRTPGTFHSILVANPAVTEFKGKTYFIFRGQTESGHDQIGMWTTPSRKADGINWRAHHPVPIIPISTDPDAPDNQHILDPGAVAIGDSLFVYYSAKAARPEPNYSICLANSTNGIDFKKHASNPILDRAIAPEVVYHNGLFYLFYHLLNANDYWEVFVATSKSGIDYDTSRRQKVFSPSHKSGAFDSYSIATVRIFKEDDYFYMTYAACTQYLDYPESVGLARSKDLIHWERYPHNPIFERGQAGTWDEGALWFPTMRKMKGKYVMWYEGAGSGMGLKTAEAREASRIAREVNYGGYLKTSFSQIGIALFEGQLKDW